MATTNSPISSKNGFTLIELAIVLVIVGLLIGIGSGMVGVLSRAVKVRESKELLDAAMQSVTSWASANNRIPDTSGFTPAVKTPTDVWGRDFIYLYDTNLNINPTKDTICGRRSTALTVQSSDPAATISNVAFVVISKSDDAAVDTKLAGTLNNPNPTVLSNEIIPSSGYVTPTAPATTATITIDANNNDIVRWVTLDELRTKVGCQGGPLKIVNNELPFGNYSAPYSATIVPDGGTGGFEWRVKSNTNQLPRGISFSPNMGLTTSGSYLVFTNGSTSSNGVGGWNTANSLTFTGQPWPAGSYSLTIMVRDSNGNSASKPFVLTINPKN